MNRSKRMEPIAQLEKQREQSAAHQLGDARQRAQGEQVRLDELLQYKQEYLAEFQRKGRAGVAGLALRQFQFFVAQLDKAIGQQRDRVKYAEVSVTERSTQYRQQAGKSKAIESAVQNMRTNEAAVRTKKEQHTLDELAARRIFEQKLVK